MPLTSRNPATGQTIATYEPHSPQEIERRLQAAHAAFDVWRTRSTDDRGDVLRAAARALERDVERHARLMTLEVGKPIQQSRAEVCKCARGLRYAAEAAEEALAPRDVSEGTRVVHEPLGPILGIMPWNFPYWQAVRFLAPALMAGNTALLKHASNVTGCLLALEEVIREADAGDAFQALVIPSSDVARVIAHPRIRGVSLTGSEPAGHAVAEAAARALKPAVLELGGSDPFLVLEDADLDEAAREAANARCVNSGESCIAAKRFFVHESAHDEFLTRFTEAMAAKRVGDPTRDDTEIGPLAREDLRDAVHGQVRRSIEEGAEALTGGAPLDGPGYYYPPTVLTNVAMDMPVLTEEVFGPVAPVVPFDTEEEMLRLANATPFGLGATIWARDLERADRLAQGIEAGMVFVNQMVQSTPEAPFGGVKHSGLGREFGAEGFRAFVNVKTRVTRPAGARGREALPAGQRHAVE